MDESIKEKSLNDLSDETRYKNFIFTINVSK